MKKLGINIFIIGLYSFPFVFFSMQQNFDEGSIVGYLLMIIFTSMIAFLGKFSNNNLAIILGNIASAIISFQLLTEMADNQRWLSFFKPLTPFQYLILVTVLNTIPQFFSMKLATIIKPKLDYIFEKDDVHIRK